MFDKSKETQETINGAAKSVDEAAQEITKVAQTVESVKDHFRRNKKFYFVGAGGAAIGATGMFFAGSGPSQVKQIVDSFKIVHIQYKSPNINVALVKQACPDPIPVRYKPTGEDFRSIRRAAEVLGMNRTDISVDAQGVQKLFEQLPDSVFA